jgi:hypothetical protein
MTVVPNTQIVGIVNTRNVPPGNTGHPFGFQGGSDASSVVMPVAGEGTALKLSPPSLETRTVIACPASGALAM